MQDVVDWCRQAQIRLCKLLLKVNVGKSKRYRLMLLHHCSFTIEYDFDVSCDGNSMRCNGRRSHSSYLVSYTLRHVGKTMAGYVIFSIRKRRIVGDNMLSVAKIVGTR